MKPRIWITDVWWHFSVGLIFFFFNVSSRPSVGLELMTLRSRVKSFMLYRLSRPGTLCIFYFLNFNFLLKYSWHILVSDVQHSELTHTLWNDHHDKSGYHLLSCKLTHCYSLYSLHCTLHPHDLLAAGGLYFLIPITFLPIPLRAPPPLQLRVLCIYESALFCLFSCFVF